MTCYYVTLFIFDKGRKQIIRLFLLTLSLIFHLNAEYYKQYFGNFMSKYSILGLNPTTSLYSFYSFVKDNKNKCDNVKPLWMSCWPWTLKSVLATDIIKNVLKITQCLFLNTLHDCTQWDPCWWTTHSTTQKKWTNIP